VVFPEPLGPIKVTLSPAATLRSKPVMTEFAPKDFDTLANSMAATAEISLDGDVGMPGLVAVKEVDEREVEC
jgi:hypothetical protein